MNIDCIEKRDLCRELLANIKDSLPELEEFLSKINDHWCYEDLLYRFYHQSFKVYSRFPIGQAIQLLDSLAPSKVRCDLPGNPFIKQILEDVPEKFENSQNENWGKFTRPIIEASLHLRFLIEMAVKYGKILNESPDCLPSGWAALLYYYGLR